MDRYSLTGEDRKLIRNEVFRSVEWIMLDRGVIDEEIAEQRILPFTGASARCSPWADRKVGRPHRASGGNAGALQALKAKGCRLYLLSNAATRQPIYWARAEASKLMDGALISAEVKLLKPDPRSTAPSCTSSPFARRNASLLTIRPSTWRAHSTKTWEASCSTWMFLPLPRACALWAWNGNIPFGEMIMMVWIGLILLICAGFSAYAGHPSWNRQSSVRSAPWTLSRNEETG